MTTETMCFKVEGDWLTKFSRTLWADEDQPQKALAVLDCLVGDSEGQEMNEEIALRILTGRAKLTGNSTDGIYLEEDHVDVTEHGNALSLQARLRRLSFKSQEAAFEILCRNQIASKNVKFMASPWGPVYVPYCAWKNITSGEWGWDELRPYIQAGDFPLTASALKERQSRYDYEDGREEIDDNCEQIHAQRAARAALDGADLEDARLVAESRLETMSDEEVEKAATDHVTTLARAGFTNLGVNETVVDKFIREQREMEENTGFPTPAADVSAENGWISPNGDFFTCGMIQHDALAIRMGSDTKTVEQTHVRVSTNSMSGYRSPLQFVGRKLTRRQKDKIWDWCEHHKVDVPPWVFGDKGTAFSKEEE